MQAATDCQHLKTTLCELTEFLGQVSYNLTNITRRIRWLQHCLRAGQSAVIYSPCHLQTYVTTCEEVARAEYAVQSSMQIVQDLRAQLSAQHDTVADESLAPSMPAPAVSKPAPGTCKYGRLHVPHQTPSAPPCKSAIHTFYTD